MSPRDFRAHPVTSTIRDAAYGGRRCLPSETDLDDLRLSPSLRTRVEEACQEVARVHDTGAHQDAWKLGDEKAAAILELVPEKQRAPGFYQQRDPLSDETDPAVLAAAIRGN